MYDPAMRAKELEGTGVPHPFVVEYEILVDDPMKLEQSVHRYLRDVNENKEWFRCDFAKCVSAIHECNNGYIYYERFFRSECKESYIKEITDIKAVSEQVTNDNQSLQIKDDKAELERKVQAYCKNRQMAQLKGWLVYWFVCVCFSVAMIGLNKLTLFICCCLLFLAILAMPSKESFRKEYIDKMRSGRL